MEITELMVYMVTRLDCIKAVLGLTMILPVAYLIIALSEKLNYDNSPNMRYVVLSAVYLAFAIVAEVFIPSTADMVTIKVVPAIVNSETAQTLGGSLPKLTKFLVDEYVNGSGR